MEILKNLTKGLFLLCAVTAPVLGEQVALDHFGYLNNNESAVIIDQIEAQDLLNVDITNNGKSIKKRDGYGEYKDVGTGTGFHGAHHFFDSTGNDVQLWGNNSILYGIIANGGLTQLVSSATAHATWDCADSHGLAYCVNSSRDALFRTNGTAAGTSWLNSVLGTMVAVTPERLMVAGVAAAPNSIYFSESNVLTNFTPGIDSISPFIEVINSPGGKITHIEYACGRILWWKDESFGYILGEDQTNLQIITVANRLGTLDNSSAIDNGGNVWFRGQDGHIYMYDCSSLEKKSIDISPSIANSSTRISNAWNITNQVDFEAGISTPTSHLSFTNSVGDVTTTSATLTDTHSADFTLGSNASTGVGILSTGTVSIQLGNTNVLNNSFEDGPGSNADEWIEGASGSRVTSRTSDYCTMAPSDGTYFMTQRVTRAVINLYVRIIDAADNTVLAEYPNIENVGSTNCAWTQLTISTTSAGLGKRVKIFITDGVSATHDIKSENSFIWGGNIRFETARGQVVDSSDNYIGYDNFLMGRSTITVGAFTSRTFNTGKTNSVVRATAAWTANDGNPRVTLQTAASSSGPWWDIVSSTGTNANAAQYVRYVASFTVASDGDARTTLNDVYILSRSSGSFYSSVRNAPSIGSWDTFSQSSVEGGGTHAFFIRTSANAFTVSSSTPAWASLTPGAVPTVSTAAYIQLRDDISIDSVDDTPVLNSMTLNWFEGTASDKAYAIFFKDAIWWSVTSGFGQSANNYIFRYDLLYPGWTAYNFGSGGFLIQNNRLFFGSVSDDKIHQYGGSTDDNGQTISAYWKSKDFPGPDPWLENEYTQLDTIYRRNPNESLTVSYALNSSTTTTSYTVSLSNATDSIIRHKKLLPTGKIGSMFNVKFSDNTDTSAWEVLGFRMFFRQLPYRPTQ